MDDDRQSAESTWAYPVATYNAGAVGWLYRAISLVGIVMALGGVVVEVALTGEMRSGLWPASQLWGALWAGEPSAWTTLGIWILLAGPALALVSMFVSGVRRRSLPAVLLAATVLLVLVLAVPLMTWLRGTP